MNERIKLLAEQAVLDSLFESIDPAFTVGTGNGKMTIPLVFAEKFAELIVREMVDECAKVCVQHAGWTPDMSAKQVKQHFGVEE